MIKGIFLFILLFLIPFSFISGQGKRVRVEKVAGYVVDNSGIPLSGAIFLADESQLNCRSNEDGYFRFKVNAETKFITVLHRAHGILNTGFQGQDSIFFSYSNDTCAQEKLLSAYEGKVDFEYGKVRRSPVSDAPKILDGSKYSTIYELIQAEVPGVSVRGTTISQIQGGASLNPNATFEPLIILNGIATSNIGNIDPRIVKSVTLLKGADASIYGSRGANGVIVIELK